MPSYRMATPVTGYWQSDHIFSGLTAGTAYTFQVRHGGFMNVPPSEASQPSAVIHTAFEVPNTSIPNIIGTTITMLALLAVSITTWLYILNQQLINNRES